MRHHLLLSLILTGIIQLTVSAQDDMSQYFDDGGIATSHRLLKIGFDPVNGEIPLIYEQQISRNISVECGTSLISMKRQSKLYEDIEKTSGMGFSAWANLRIYLKEYYERFYVGFQPRISFLGGKSYTDIIFFNAGYQRPINGRLIFDINAGMGVRSYKEDDTVINTVVYENGRGSAFYIPVQIKIGYAF